MPIPGNLLTTAMAVMPHTDVDRALEMALSLDVPFWPQLPNFSYHEDMYVQASEGFPGIVLDLEKRTLRFSIEKFITELEETMSRFDDPQLFDISPEYSAVYHRFLTLELRDRPAIRGQMEGPISFGFNILDQDERPILFDDTVRPFMLEYMAKRLNVQLSRLKTMNSNAFMFVDEPGLQFLFSALAGYNDMKAKGEMDQFFASVDRPRGVHLCGNPDWDFLLGLDLDVLSMDIYTNAEVFGNYAKSIQRFLDKGGIIVWGIVPTGMEPFSRESRESLGAKLLAVWETLGRKGVDISQIVRQGMLSPATCCLVNPDKALTVERAFAQVRALSGSLQDRFGRYLTSPMT